MNASRDIQTIEHLKRSVEDNNLRRALAARLNRALKRAGISSAKVAKWLGVSEDDVQLWRRGVTVPQFHYFTRIADFVKLDVHWLCTGQTPAA
jgi:ribosome-binding protein aMBF1 (putative translation factor)